MTRAQSGWLFSLGADRSHWGYFEKCHGEIFANHVEQKDAVVTLNLTELFGTTFSREHRIEEGDGLAFYHNEQAVFPDNDLFQKVPRISLIATVTDVDQEGRAIHALQAETSPEQYAALLAYPFLHAGDNADLFETIMEAHRNVAWWPIRSSYWQQITDYAESLLDGRDLELNALWNAYREKYGN